MKAGILSDLTGKVALVTGGGGFLGSGFAEALAQAGASVSIADIRREVCLQTATTISDATGTKVVGIHVDITQQAAVEEMVKQVVTDSGKLDILVNSAQSSPVAGYFDPFEDYRADVWQQVVGADLTSTFLCCQAAGRRMATQGRGVILNISSIYGVTAPDFRIYGDSGVASPAVYSVTKAGIIGLSRYLATYWAGKNIRVNTLTPGGVQAAQDPEFVARYASRTPMARMANRSDLLGAMLYLVSDASAYVTGHNLVVDGGWTAW